MQFPLLEKYPKLLQCLLETLQSDQKIYLIGGAVRDALLKRDSHDLDFTLSGRVKQYARSVSNQLGGAFYMLDEVRDTARVILPFENKKLVLDFAALRGKNIEDDILKRDFTINAIGWDVNSRILIDPLNGARHLLKKKLIPCTENSFTEDPVRILRSVRFSLSYDLKIEKDTVQLIKESVHLLPGVSEERKRDEIFKIFDGKKIKTALELLDHFEVLEQIFPEICSLKNIQQGKPHVFNAWEHTLQTQKELEKLIKILSSPKIDDKNQNLMDGLAILHLRPYQKELADHYKKWLNPNRSARSVLFFAALLHDCGKAETQMKKLEKKFVFPRHETVGSKIAEKKGKYYALSQKEVNRVKTIVEQHHSFHDLNTADSNNAHRKLYRFFMKNKETVIDLCLLALADVRAAYGHSLQQAHWLEKLEICKMVFEAYWRVPVNYLDLPDLVSGTELIEKFSLTPGPIIGELRAAIREALAMGQISNKEEALQFAEKRLKKRGK